jgi:hypothetical protein
VAEVFKANFSAKADGTEDLGASFVVYKDGKEIVAMTGGWQDVEKVRLEPNRLLVNSRSSVSPERLSS